jgi:hypothetical protein
VKTRDARHHAFERGSAGIFRRVVAVEEIDRLRKPLLCPNESEREGYVPNVVYTCGALLHGRDGVRRGALTEPHRLIAIETFG